MNRTGTIYQRGKQRKYCVRVKDKLKNSPTFKIQALKDHHQTRIFLIGLLFQWIFIQKALKEKGISMKASPNTILLILQHNHCSCCLYQKQRNSKAHETMRRRDGWKWMNQSEGQFTPNLFTILQSISCQGDERARGKRRSIGER